MDPPDATYLDIILYSREQIILENIAMGSPVCIYVLAVYMKITSKCN